MCVPQVINIVCRYISTVKYKHPSNQLIARVPMTSNHLFPLKIVPNNTEDAFKEESKEEVAHCNKKQNDSVDFQATFQTEVQDDS